MVVETKGEITIEYAVDTMEEKMVDKLLKPQRNEMDKILKQMVDWLLKTWRKEIVDS